MRISKLLFIFCFGMLVAFFYLFAAPHLYQGIANVIIQTETEIPVQKRFQERRGTGEHAKTFQPMILPMYHEDRSKRRETPRLDKYAAKEAMDKLNKASVPADDPRLIKLIREFYLEPPSTEAYNLDFPDRLEYSNGQTPFVDSRLNYMEGGFYVEAGALNGEKGSNTLFFEKVRKWNGLLVEPDPNNFAMLKSKKRKAFIVNACLSTNNYPSLVTFNKAFNRGRVVHGQEVKDWIRRQGIKPNTVLVQCFPLQSLLLALNQTTVDFLSLDVEGDELRVLNTIPFNKINIKMMTVETAHEMGGYGGLKSFVEGQGYDSLLQMSRWDGGVHDIIFRKKGLSH